jgi:hypothetical protein
LRSATVSTRSVDEPGALTPTFAPLKSASVLIWSAFDFSTATTICGARPISTNAR